MNKLTTVREVHFSEHTFKILESLYMNIFIVNHLVEHHRNVRLSSFHLTSGHTLGFHAQTQKIEPPSTA